MHGSRAPGCACRIGRMRQRLLQHPLRRIPGHFDEIAGQPRVTAFPAVAKQKSERRCRLERPDRETVMTAADHQRMHQRHTRARGNEFTHGGRNIRDHGNTWVDPMSREHRRNLLARRTFPIERHERNRRQVVRNDNPFRGKRMPRWHNAYDGMLHQRLRQGIRILHPRRNKPHVQLAIDQRFADPLRTARFNGAVRYPDALAGTR